MITSALVAENGGHNKEPDCPDTDLKEPRVNDGVTFLKDEMEAEKGGLRGKGLNETDRN